MKKSDLERLKKIVESWNKLKKQIDERHISKESLMKDEFLQWAVTTPLYNIGEQVYQLSDETKQLSPSLPWKAVAGLRHRLVHDYDGTNWEIIAEVLFTEMDSFVMGVSELIEKMQNKTAN